MLLSVVVRGAALLSGSGVPAEISAAHTITEWHQARSGGAASTDQSKLARDWLLLRERFLCDVASRTQSKKMLGTIEMTLLLIRLLSPRAKPPVVQIVSANCQLPTATIPTYILLAAEAEAAALWSTIRHRSDTTLMPAWAKASSNTGLVIPLCSQTAAGWAARMSSRCGGRSEGFLNTSKMSICPAHPTAQQRHTCGAPGWRLPRRCCSPGTSCTLRYTG